MMYSKGNKLITVNSYMSFFLTGEFSLDGLLEKYSIIEEKESFIKSNIEYIYFQFEN